MAVPLLKWRCETKTETLPSLFDPPCSFKQLQKVIAHAQRIGDDG
jgi:hypothetical protein